MVVGPGGPGEQDEHESTACCCSNKSKLDPRRHSAALLAEMET